MQSVQGNQFLPETRLGKCTMKPLTKATAQILAPIQFRSTDRLELTLQRGGEHFTAKIFSVDENGNRGCASWAARHEFCERIPERFRINKETSRDGYVESYTFGATDTTVVVIATLWPKSQVIFNGQDAATVYNYLVFNSINYDGVAEMNANYQENNIVPPAAFPQRDDVQLAPHQILATVCSLRAESFDLFHEMGTGKSAVAVTVACALAARSTTGKTFRILCIAPKNVRTNWVDEFEKFKTCGGRTTVVRGGQLDRVKCFIDAFSDIQPHEKFTCLIVGYESATKMLPALKTTDWDFTILDEGHSIKNPKAKRTHACMELRDISARKILLTGTPITNSAMDLYTQLEFLGKGFSGFSSFAAFKRFYGVFDKNLETGFEKLVGFQNAPFMQERLARYSSIVRKEQALPDLPPKVRSVIDVQMSDEQRKVYDDLRKTLVAEIDGALNSAGANMAVVITHALTKLLRLAQITSGFLPLSEESETEFDATGIPKQIKSVYRFEPNPKLEALIEDFKEQPPESKTIIWACWQYDIRAIAERMQAEGIYAVEYHGKTKDDDREAAKIAFNTDPNCRVLIGNAGAGGVGLNLLGHVNGEQETNCDNMYYYSQDWSAVKRGQSEDRAHRRNTRVPLRIKDLCVPGTIDEEIRARVVKKLTMAYELSDVRAILKAVLQGIINDD